MDHILRSWENGVRGGMQLTGAMYQWLGATMNSNPWTRPWGELMNDYGNFLTEKHRPVTYGPWMTANRVVHREMKVALRKFNNDNKGNPLLLVPPEAGHNSLIADYGPEQSMVQCALDHFDGDIYVMEKLPAGPEHADYSIADCIQALDMCVRYIGKPVHLVGLCQGGWQSAMYAALFTERVKTLTLAGAPIDFHSGDSLITEWAQSLPLSFFQSMVSMGYGCMPGAFIVGGFKLMNALDRFIGDDIQLYKHINDPKFVERYRRFNAWYQYTQPVPGKMYLEVVEQLFKKNQLVKGRFKFMGRSVDLSRIYHPLHLIAGTNDDITPPPQLFAVADHVSSPQIEKRLVKAGHIGVFMATKVIEEVWTEIFERLSGFTIADSFGIDIRLFENKEKTTPVSPS